ncbi:MAG TPA: PHP domain-containing protein, partial [bacterium]|nr:PHP domain-containing protein [bacterium]
MSERELRKVFADLHVHTALSPCADDSATPAGIVSAALDNGMGMIAITDHNSAENVGAVMSLGAKLGLKVIPGMELTTAEEVHLVCLFETERDALRMQEIAYPLLPPVENQPDVFGRQLIFDSEGNPNGECTKMLIGATSI